MRWPQVVEMAVFVAGLGLVAYGCWLLEPALGFLVPGAIMVLAVIVPHKRG